MSRIRIFLFLASLFFATTRLCFGTVTNLQARASVTGQAGVQTREGNDGHSFSDLSTNTPATSSGSASASAGPAQSTASASGSASVNLQGSELRSLQLHATATVNASSNSTDPEENGAGGSASGGANVSFQITEAAIAVIEVSGSASMSGGSRFTVQGASPTQDTLSISGTLPGDAGRREVLLLPGVLYGFEVDAGANASFAQGVPGGNASVTLSVDFGAGTNRFQWVNRAGGSYFDTNNWSPPHVPTKDAFEADLAFFNLPVQYTVDSTGAAPAAFHSANIATARTATADRWVITAGEVRNIGGATLSGTSTEQPSLSLGNGARLNLQSGTLKTFHTRIGDLPGNRSELWIMGEGTRWENNGFLFLGDYGPGELLAFDSYLSTLESRIGGTQGSSGEAFVRGTHAEWDSGNMAVGFGDAHGFLNLEDGGVLNVDELYVGYGDGSQGRVTISGGGAEGFPSLLNATNKVVVGMHGPGELILTNGGWAQSTKDLSVSSTEHSSSNARAGVVRVTGVGSDNRRSFLFFDSLNLGGNGRLEITDGALAEFSGPSYLGYAGGAAIVVAGVNRASGLRSTLALDDTSILAPFPNGSSTLTITDGSLAKFKGDFFVGAFDSGLISVHTDGGGHSAELQIDGALNLGDAQMIIRDGGFVQTKSATVGFSSDAEAQVVIDADRGFPAWTINGNLRVGDEGKGQILFFPDGLVSVSQNVFITPNKGMLCGNGIVRTPDLTNSGTICPGNSPGTLTIDGNFTQTDSGKLIIEIAGTGPGEFDVLNVTGNATLGGTVEYRLIDFFNPRAGDTIQPVKLPPSAKISANHVISGHPLGLAAVAGSFANGQFQITSVTETNYNILHTFGPTNTEAVNAWGRLTLASDGYLYGCARNGGPSGGGSIFRLHPDGYDYEVLHLFTPDSEGAQPLGGVIEARDGFLYGTASIGGTNNAGTIWRITKNGTGFTVLHHFASTVDLRTPSAELLESRDGLLFGTAFTGGGFGRGGVFQINPDGTKYVQVTGFGGSLGDEPSGPVGGLVEGPDHEFYGTTENGGSANKGAVFRMSRNGLFFTMKSLGLVKGGAENPDGTLLLDSKGALFGTTFAGGSSGFGTVFTLNLDGSGFAVLKNLGASPSEGREPRAGLIETSNGLLAGTTRIGGQNGQGTLYLINKDGTGYRTLHSFSGADEDGARARAPLIEPMAGVFYGSTFGGGAGDNGVLFRFFAQEIIPPPILAEKPLNLVVAPGDSITLRAAATNVLPAFYQWQHAGTNIPGARGPTLTLSSLAVTNVGAYSVTVRNLSGHSTNSLAQLALFDIDATRSLIVAGQPGAHFRIDYTETLSAPNLNWQTLTNIILTSNFTAVTDGDSAGRKHRFYRCALLIQ